MKTTNLLSLTITVLVALSQPTWAQPSGGGSGHFGGAGFGGGHVGGGAARFGSARVSGSNGGGFRTAPGGFGGARFTSRSLGPSSNAFRYYNAGGHIPATRSYISSGRQNRSISSSAGRPAMMARSQNRSGASATRNTRDSTSAVQRAIANHKVFTRHDGNWHRDWDRHRAHFDHGHVFVFVNGFWWGLYPWDYYPYYGYGYGGYPYDYSYDYPYDYSGYPYEGYGYSPSDPYSYYNGYAPSDQYSSGVVSAVQSKLASLGYYHGATDGILGDQTEAALARYQQDQDLSVTGTVNAATLQALGLPYSGS
jgi:Putative peptidoglycan binding domain